jgi:hypothetical protein
MESRNAAVQRPWWISVVAVVGGSSLIVALVGWVIACSCVSTGFGIASNLPGIVDMSTGVTVTEGAAPGNGAKAVPAITPVPSEELGEIPNAAPGTHRH